MLAQLLIQFQKPIVSENAFQNITNDSINNTLPNQFNSTIITERNIPSLPLSEDTRNDDDINSHIIRKRFVATEHSSNGKYFYISISTSIYQNWAF